MCIIICKKEYFSNSSFGATLTIPWCGINVIDPLFYSLTYRFNCLTFIIRTVAVSTYESMKLS